MNKFRVGDKVSIINIAGFSPDYNLGDIGTIDAVNGNEYIVEMFDGIPQSCSARDIEKVKKTFKEVVTLEFDGDKTTASTNDGRKASVYRYSGDEYSKEIAASEAVKKLYHQFPKKGDTYYAVYIEEKGAMVYNFVYEKDHAADLLRMRGNFYETKEAAQKVADKINKIFEEEGK